MPTTYGYGINSTILYDGNYQGFIIISSDTNNIEIIGNSNYLQLDKNKNPVTYFKNDQLVNFYNKFQIRVSGPFPEINKTYLYNEDNNTITTIDDRIRIFDKSRTNTLLQINNLLDFGIISQIIPTNKFFYEGNDGNGVKIEGLDKNTLEKNEVISNVLSYFNFEKSNCFYISTNNILNYFPQLDDNNFIIGKWKDNYYSDGTPFFNLEGLEAETVNYGIDKQSYGYSKINYYTYGKPFKIPSNPEYIKQKKIPESYYPSDVTNIKKESFWYKNDKYWKDLMTDKKYENIFLNDREILTPSGTIGVMINGISVYNHLDFYDNITEEIVQNGDSFIVNRILNKNNTNISLYNKVNIQNFDNHGGTIDRNHNYNYNKYPVGLEAMIRLGTYNAFFVDEGTPIEIEDKVFCLNGNAKGVYYLNFSHLEFSKSPNFNLELIEKNDLSYSYSKTNIEIFLLGKPINNYSSTIIIKILELPESKEIKYDLFIRFEKTTGIVDNPYKIINYVKKITFKKNKETTDTNEANSIYYLKYIDENTIDFYLPKQFDNPSFQYKGYLNKINSEVESENEIMLYMKTMLKLATENSNDIDTFHSPLLGWAFDGFPIYGQIGYKDKDALKLLKTSYNTDYQYVQGSGDLDFCNGIYCPTPEFPEGIYHYICTLCVDDNDKITFKTYIDVKKSLYAYPYIIGAYKGVPEISNFDFEKKNSYFKNNYSSDSINEFTNSNSLNNKDVNPLSSNNFNTQSSLVISNQTNYDINFRSLKSNSDKYNGEEIQEINISQDENYIELQQGSKPYIWNFTDSEAQNEYFGKTNNNYGNTLNNLIGDNEAYLKAYGTVKRFKYLEEPGLGNTVIYNIDNNNIYVKKTDNNKPILGIVINIDVNNNLCYVCTDGMCEIINISGYLDKNDLLKSNNDGTISKYDNSIDTGNIYIIGNYIGINSNRHLINIQPKTLII
uniref:YHYH domain-containing protein n=1 Tax=Mimiviridae sp. ChoanoV1 TaxID=2596887 RepID=A0A5B8IFH9_9VIRU|nr:hypothetical protein 1_112 [Mimiviridae sp. ChoanoV1]